MANTKKYVSFDKLGVYDELLKAKITADDAATLASAKSYADGLAVNYEKSGSVATALAEAKTYADGKDAAIAAAKTAGDNAQSTIDAYKTSNDTVVQGLRTDLDNLDSFVGDIPEGYEQTNVIAYVNKKAEEVLTQATGGSTESAASVKAQLDEYKASNNAKVDANTTAAANAQSAAEAAQTAADTAQDTVDALAEKVGEVPADKTVVQMISEAQASATYDDAQVKADIATNAEAIATEKARMDAFMTLEDGETLNAALDSLKEIQDYITSEAAEADVIVGKVSALEAIVDGIGGEGESATVVAYVTSAIEALKIGEYAKAADLTALAERMTTAEGKIATAEGNISDNADAIAALQAAIADGGSVDVRFDALEAAIGESGSVADDIATAKQEAIDSAKSYADTQDGVTLASAKKYTDDEIDVVEGAIATLTETVGTKATQADLTALTNRVATNETNIGTLQTEMDAVEALAAANKLAHEANAQAIALKASQTDLDAVSGRVTVLETWHNNFTEVSEEEINSLFN